MPLSLNKKQYYYLLKEEEEGVWTLKFGVSEENILKNDRDTPVT